MRIVVIGGQARKIGKTSVMAGLIRGLRQLNWTAVKISTHDGGIPHCSDADGTRAGPGRGFMLTEETEASTLTDTGRFLAADARRAFWLRVKSDCLVPALAVLFKALANEPNVIIESGSAMGALSPRIGIFVLDRSRREMKANARRALAKADAVVEIVSGKRAATRFPRLPSGAAKFTVTRKEYSNPKLVRFVLLKLQRLADARLIPSQEHADLERNPNAGTQRD
jgi:hypothetical protein